MFKSLTDDIALTRLKCFEIGWHLLNLDTWEYIDLWTGKRGTVTVESLNAALMPKPQIEPVMAKKKGKK